MTLTALWLSLTPCAATAEWKALPRGSVLTEDSIVGSIEDGRRVVERTQSMAARIDLQDEALAAMEEKVRLMSVSLAEAQGKIAEVPELLRNAEEEFQKEIQRERRKGTVTLAVAVVVAVASVLH